MKKLMLLFALGVLVCSFVAVQTLNAQQTAPSSQKAPAATSERMGDQSTTKQMKSDTSRGASDKAETLPMQASELIGKSLKDPNDNRLGKVEDLMVDKDGRISYVIIGFGGVLGAGEKYTAIPWNVFASKQGHQKEARGDLKIDISKGDFEKAPVFEKSQLQNFAAGESRQKVDSYFSSSEMKRGRVESEPR